MQVNGHVKGNCTRMTILVFLGFVQRLSIALGQGRCSTYDTNAEYDNDCFKNQFIHYNRTGFPRKPSLKLPAELQGSKFAPVFSCFVPQRAGALVLRTAHVIVARD